MQLKTNILTLSIVRRLLIAVIVMLCASNVSAQRPTKLSREQVNVFWLMNFAKYVEWPNDTASEYIVGMCNPFSRGECGLF